MTVTVGDLLDLPTMGKATVVAGSQGLNHQVRWVHVSEVLDIARFLKGGELLLSTGMGLAIPPDGQARFVADLASRGVAALALALRPWMHQVPAALATAAEAAHLPLLAFDHEVPFIQITEEVHTLIVNRHYADIRQAEAVARQLNEAALRNQNATALLRILYQVLKNPVACVPTADPAAAGRLATSTDGASAGVDGGGELVSYYPPGDWGPDLVARVAGLGTPDPATGSPAASGSLLAPGTVTAGQEVSIRVGAREVGVWLQPIVISGQGWGYLAVAQSQRPLGAVERLIVDRAAVTLAYEILRRQALREQRQATAADLTESVLSGHVTDVDQLYRQARALGHELENRWLAAGVLQLRADTPREKVEQVVVAASRGMPLGWLTSWRLGEARLLLHGDSEAFLRRGMLALNRAAAGLRSVAGFSRPVRNVADLPQAFHQAWFAAAVHRHLAGSSLGPTFDALGVYRLLMGTVGPADRQHFVNDELGPLIGLARPEAATLLTTLRLLLDSNLAMAETARQLGTCRQTVYQRRARVERLLSCSLDCPEKRLALGMALRAAEVSTSWTLNAGAEEK